jgi:hypothetical protein
MVKRGQNLGMLVAGRNKLGGAHRLVLTIKVFMMGRLQPDAHDWAFTAGADHR